MLFKEHFITRHGLCSSATAQIFACESILIQQETKTLKSLKPHNTKNSIYKTVFDWHKIVIDSAPIA